MSVRPRQPPSSSASSGGSRSTRCSPFARTHWTFDMSGAETSQPRFRVNGLAFGYGSNIVQHDVSFDVQDKSIFAIMGGSGCGKSTLMKAMVGLVKPHAGTIL